jgi:hypothetical protein
MKRGLMVGLGTVLTILVVAWVISCGGGGSSGGSDGNINFGPAGQGIVLDAGETWALIFTVNFDPGDFGGPYESIVLDLEDNISNLTFSPGAASAGLSASPLVVETATLTLHVAPADAASTVCTKGTQYGPFEITLDESSQPDSVSPETLIASQSTLDIINFGTFAVCVEITSSIDAETGMNGADFILCNESIADIAGTWVGDYSCGGNCPESGEIELWITQTPGTPGYANYTDDGGAFYSGNVCGFRFEFEGGGIGYDESGTFIMDPSGLTATKTSTYMDNFPGTCSGSCLDTLHRLGVE